MDPAEQARLDREAEKALAEQDKLIHVEAHDRKVLKAIDTSRLEVKEEHLYPDLDNKEDYTEMAPEVTDSLALAPVRCISAGSSATSSSSRVIFRWRTRTGKPSG